MNTSTSVHFHNEEGGAHRITAEAGLHDTGRNRRGWVSLTADGSHVHFHGPLSALRGLLEAGLAALPDDEPCYVPTEAGIKAVQGVKV